MTTSPPLADGNSINVLKKWQQTTNDKRRKCYNCRREGHLARDRNCPARGKKCAKCGRYGHLLCVVVVRGTVMWLGEEQASNKGILVDDHVT